MALTDVAIRNAKPGAKAIKLADGGGSAAFGVILFFRADEGYSSLHTAGVGRLAAVPAFARGGKETIRPWHRPIR